MEFDEKLKKYYDRLRENPELLENIMKNSKNQNSLDIMLLPNNEKELRVAEAAFNLMEDILKVIEDAYYGELKTIDIEDCAFANMFVNIINALKNKDKEKLNEIEEWLTKNVDMKTSAKLIYEMVVVFAQNPEEFAESIASKCGFDLEDELSMLQFQLYMSKASEYSNKANKNVDLSNLDNLTDKKVDSIVEFTNEFHNAYLEGLKEGKNSSLTLEPNN